MFQNSNENVISEKNKSNIFSNVFAKNNIVLYIVSFMLSLVGLNGEFSVFSICMLAASFSNGVPLLGIIIVSLIGNLVKFGIGGGLEYFLTALLFIASLFILKPRYNEMERNEKIKVGSNVVLAVLLVQIIKFTISGFTLYDVLFGISLSIIALVFYKIFINSLVVIQEFYEKRAFSIEEVIRSKPSTCYSRRSIWQFKHIWIWNSKHIKHINSYGIRLEKWNTCWNNIGSYNWYNCRSYIRHRANNDSSLCNIWYASPEF